MSRLSEGVRGAAAVLIATLTLAACQPSLNERPPVAISPAWDVFLGPERAADIIIDPRNAEAKQEFMTFERVAAAFLANNGITPPTEEAKRHWNKHAKFGDIRPWGNLYVDVSIGDRIHDGKATVMVADALKYEVIVRLSIDKRSKCQIKLSYGLDDNDVFKVSNPSVYYNSKSPVDEEFFFYCLEAAFTEGAQ